MRIRCELWSFFGNTIVMIVSIIIAVLFGIYLFAWNFVASFMKEFNKAFPNSTGPMITGIVSISTAYFILEYQEVRKRRSLIKSLYDEVKTNHSASAKIEPIIKIIEEHPEYRGITRKTPPPVFDIPLLYKSVYDNLRFSGELHALPSDIKEKLESAYKLIESHNRQKTKMESEEDPDTREMVDRANKIPSLLEHICIELSRQFCYLPQEKKAEASDEK